jgi:hypothetical protein
MAISGELLGWSGSTPLPVARGESKQGGLIYDLLLVVVCGPQAINANPHTVHSRVNSLNRGSRGSGCKKGFSSTNIAATWHLAYARVGPVFFLVCMADT